MTTLKEAYNDGINSMCDQVNEDYFGSRNVIQFNLPSPYEVEIEGTQDELAVAYWKGATDAAIHINANQLQGNTVKPEFENFYSYRG